MEGIFLLKKSKHSQQYAAEEGANVIKAFTVAHLNLKEMRELFETLSVDTETKVYGQFNGQDLGNLLTFIACRARDFGVDLDVLEYLLSMGVPTNIKNYTGKTAIDYFKEYDHEEVLKVISYYKFLFV